MYDGGAGLGEIVYCMYGETSTTAFLRAFVDVDDMHTIFLAYELLIYFHISLMHLLRMIRNPPPRIGNQISISSFVTDGVVFDENC
jgi:hypothetical protein